MKKRPSLIEALQRHEISPNIVAKSPRPVITGEEKNQHAVCRVGKKALIGYFDPSVSKQLKQIALDRDETIQHLLAEALNDLFRKLKKPTIAG